jgi:hypothetical protein
MRNRKYAYVNEKQNQARIDRANLRYRTLKDHGGTDDQVRAAVEKSEELYEAQHVLRGDPRWPSPN